jgi:transcriptional regulator with PAS, ATPase and Fis domain
MGAPHVSLVNDECNVRPCNESFAEDDPRIKTATSVERVQPEIDRGPAPSPHGAPAPESAVNSPAQVESLDDELFFVAASPAMTQIRAQVAQIAKVNVPVLLLGESGVGKEILARLIHKISNRAHRNLVKVNCAALPATLLESELFGYEAGAFTGAKKSKPGNFELAHQGTILLDEIGEMSAPLQAKLLHVLQDGKFSRLGGRADIKVDARILAATNIDIKRAIAERRLREDLYYRLNALTILIPPLRERRQEIPHLLACFIKAVARKFGKNPLPVSDRMMQACLRYHWPGNLRQLHNFAQRYLVLEQEDLVLEDLEAPERSERPVRIEYEERKSSPVYAHGGLKALVRSLQDDAEAKVILRVLEDCNWDRKAAAARLQISYKALSYKMQEYKISQRGLGPAGEQKTG